MKIILITPAKKYSKNGNRTTALRWSKILRKLGHKVTIDIEYRGGKADLMIALHAWRSAESIKEFKHSCPSGKIIVALTGTDFNEFMHSHPETTLCSMEYANRLVCLHDQVARVLPRKFHSKLRVIYQSAVSLKKQYTKSLVYFDVCLVAHMRAVKDPVRGPLAVRLVNKNSRLRIVHLGKAHNETWEKWAKEEEKNNPRYVWRGEKVSAEVRRVISKSQLLLVSSRSEGGANVISESLALGTPIIASDIDGNIGMLGNKYPGYYKVGDEKELKKILIKCEIEPDFLRELREHCQNRALLISLSEETSRWSAIIRELSN